MASNVERSLCCLLCYKDADPLLGEFIPKYSCHLLCLRFASGISNKIDFPKEEDFIKEVNRAKKIKCKYCSKPRASLRCSEPKCKTTYHLSCAKKNNSINFHDTFMSYCDQHSIPQTEDSSGFMFEGEKPCEICGQNTRLEEALTSLCCLKINHRSCIQDQASRGKQFCINCGDSTSLFLYDMLYYGIYFKGHGNEKDFMNAGKTSPSPIIKKLLEEKTRRPHWPVSIAKAIRKRDETKPLIDLEMVEKEAAESYIIMLLLSAGVTNNQLMITHNLGDGTKAAPLNYFKKYMEIRIRKGYKTGEILKDCLKKTTVLECLHKALDNQWMKTELDEYGVKHYFIDDSLVINGVKIAALTSLLPLRETTLRSLHNVSDAIAARIAAEESLTACSLVVYLKCGYHAFQTDRRWLKRIASVDSILPSGSTIVLPQLGQP